MRRSGTCHFDFGPIYLLSILLLISLSNCRDNQFALPSVPPPGEEELNTLQEPQSPRDMGLLQEADTAQPRIPVPDLSSDNDSEDPSPETDLAPAPLIEGETLVRLIAVGDTGEASSEQYLVAEGIQHRCNESGGCHGLLMLGDNIYDDGPESADDDEFDTKIDLPYANLRYGAPPEDGEEDLRERLPLYISLGNHDLGGMGLENELIAHYIEYGASRDWFYYPSEWWATEVGIVHIISLHTNPLAYLANQIDEQGTFVNSIVNNTPSTWTVSFGHHPYRSNGPHGNAGEYEGLPLHLPLLGEGFREFVDDYICNKVDFYISGHDHNRQWLESVPDIPSWPPFQATVPCKTHFAVSGAGAKLHDLMDRNNSLAFGEGTLGFLLITFTPEEAVAEFCDENGNIEWTYQIDR